MLRRYSHAVWQLFSPNGKLNGKKLSENKKHSCIVSVCFSGIQQGYTCIDLRQGKYDQAWRLKKNKLTTWLQTRRYCINFHSVNLCTLERLHGYSIDTKPQNYKQEAFHCHAIEFQI